MRVLLCGGGTAGHVYPALAISEIIKRNDENSEFAYVVTEKGIENNLVKYKKYKIEARGIKRKAFFSNICTAFLTLKAIRTSKTIIKDFKPDLVIGTGGYSCFPVLYSASKLGIKTAIHESNVNPGKTTMMLAKYMNLIMLNYAESKKFFENHKNVKIVGSPIRDGFICNDLIHKKDNYTTILCFGGSLGAKKINESALLIVENIISKRKDIKFIWGCGNREYDKCKKDISCIIEKNNSIENLVELKGYINNMTEVLPKADIVICRAGAMSISELAYNGKCAVLIPSPNVADDHQLKNAQALSDKNAAILITEDKIEDILIVIDNLLSDTEKRRELSMNIKKFAKSDTNKTIYKEIMKLF